MAGGESYSVSIGVSASGVEQAISQLSQLDQMLNQLNGKSANVNVELSGDVINRIADIEDTINRINGTTANVGVEVNSDVQNQIADVQDQINQIDGSTATVNIDINEAFDEGMNTIQRAMSSGFDMSGIGGYIMGAANKASSAMLKYGGMAASLLGGIGVKRFISDFSNFEYEQATVQGVIDPSERTPEKLQQLNDAAFQYTSKGYNPYEVSQSQTELARAGFNVGQINDILPAMMNISNAGGLDLGTSTLITSSVLRSFSMESKDAAHVADVLAKTANSTASDINGLGQSIKYSGSMANTLGIPLESLSATIGTLANYNIRGLRKCGPVVRKLAA